KGEKDREAPLLHLLHERPVGAGQWPGQRNCPCGPERLQPRQFTVDGRRRLVARAVQAEDIRAAGAFDAEGVILGEIDERGPAALGLSPAHQRGIEIAEWQAPAPLIALVRADGGPATALNGVLSPARSTPEGRFQHSFYLVWRLPDGKAPARYRLAAGVSPPAAMALVVARVVLGIDVVDAEGADAVELDHRRLLRPGEVRLPDRDPHEAARRQYRGRPPFEGLAGRHP